MSYLRKRDYFTEISEADLDEVLEAAILAQDKAMTPDEIRLENELKVQSLVEDMVRQRYDVEKIFVDIIAFDTSITFQIEDITQYTEPAYDPSITYVIGDRRSHSFLKDEGSLQVQADDIFKANVNITAAEDFNISKWDKITENGSLYVCKTPSTGNKPDTAFAFTLNNFTGNHDLIDGWDKTKTIFLKRVLSQVRLYFTSADRDSDVNRIGVVDFDPVAKEFPDNRPITGGDDEENTVSGDLSFIGFVPDLTTWDVIPSNFFVKEDNRNRSIRWALVNMAIFELHKLIEPRNIPELRMIAKDDAEMWLKKVSRGEITADLPLYHDDQRGQNIAFGSNKKKDYVF